jgi:hypothetical protein
VQRSNYSFKPNPLRGIACVPALRLHAFAATARVGLTQVLGLMSDKFAALEESKWRITLGVLPVLFLLTVLILFQWSGAPSTPVTGIVESAGAVSVARISGATREAASIRLSNGSLVIAQVLSGGPLAPGDHVRLLEEHRVLGGPAYQVVAKDSPAEP